VKSATGDTAKEYIRNDFRNLYLTHQGLGKPVKLAHFDEFPFNDSTVNWDVQPLVWVGGTPPEPYQTINPSGTRLLLMALGPPFDETSALRVDEEYVFPSSQTWVIDLNDTWFLTN
jgi:hypothetical protein